MTHRRPKPTRPRARTQAAQWDGGGRPSRASPHAALSDLAGQSLAGRIPDHGAQVRAVSLAIAGPALSRTTWVLEPANAATSAYHNMKQLHNVR